MSRRVVASTRTFSLIVYSVILFMTIIFLILKFKFVISDGNSMSPTINESDLIFCSTDFIYDNDYKIGDIVVAELTSDVRLVKRIAAMAGDTLIILDGSLYVNDKKVSSGFKEDYPQIVIPEGKVFLIGDNLNRSIDSRDSSIGLVDLEDEVKYKVIV